MSLVPSIAGCGGGSPATQAQQEAATSDSVYVSPATQQYHPSAAKGWVNFVGTGTVSITGSYNVTSITDNGTGDYDVNWSTNFSGTDHCVVGSQSGGARYTDIQGLGVAEVSIRTFNSTPALVDADRVFAVAFGDQ